MVNKESDDANNNVDMDSCKPFKLPCILKYEDLMAKFSGKLEIRCMENGSLAPIKRKCVPSKEFGKNDHIINDLSESNHVKENGGSEENGLTLTRRSSRGSSGRNSSSADSPDEVQFRAPQPPPPSPQSAVKRRTTKKRFVTAATSSSTTTTTSTTRRHSTDTSANRQSPLPRRPEEGEAKPGTVGSRQTVKVPQRTNKREQQQQVLNRRQPNIFGGLKINPVQDVIDTKNFVEDTMIIFLPELCQRVGIETPPKDPMELCLKFNLIVPDINLDTELEPECIDMTGDGD